MKSIGITVDNCTEGELRLVNGSNSENGRVEICRRGCWGTVCDDGWDSHDAVVACRQLGFDTEIAIPTIGAFFGEGNDRPIHVSQVACQRNDSALRLMDCTIKRPGGLSNICRHTRDAGVICKGWERIGS